MWGVEKKMVSSSVSFFFTRTKSQKEESREIAHKQHAQLDTKGENKYPSSTRRRRLLSLTHKKKQNVKMKRDVTRCTFVFDE